MMQWIHLILPLPLPPLPPRPWPRLTPLLFPLNGSYFISFTEFEWEGRRGWWWQGGGGDS